MQTLNGDRRTSSEEHVRQLVREEQLPHTEDVTREGWEAASRVEIGQSAFLQYVGATSEYDYKRSCMADGSIMYHAHIGMNDAASTFQALRYLDEFSEQRGFRMDRAGVALDRRMGLPGDMRAEVPAETGPMLENRADWIELAACARIQPHMGDFVIGQPASMENTLHALSVGATTVGNLSQYFAHSAPGWTDVARTSIETTKAIAMLSGLREQGVMLHSYLEDGYGALFQDCVTVGAWAYLEKYIVQELLGARLSHCIGGLTSDPVKRAGWVFALKRIHDQDAAGSMFYGDTISFTSNFDENRGLIAEYLLWDILAQLHTPTGHAVLPLPVTEAIRVPSAEEIAEAHVLGRRVEQTARRLLPYFDFSAADSFADAVCRGGRVIFANALSGLKALGVDIRDPLQLLHTLKRMGPARFERLYGLGEVDESEPHGRKARIPTDIYKLSVNVVEEHRELFLRDDVRGRLRGTRLLLASADVHEHAIFALGRLLCEAGALVTNLGPEQGPERIVEASSDQGYDAILLSTHNGNALAYAEQLKRRLEQSGCETPVILGGVLNQKVETQALPVTVAEEIRALGFQPATSLPVLPKLLKQE